MVMVKRERQGENPQYIIGDVIEKAANNLEPVLVEFEHGELAPGCESMFDLDIKIQRQKIAPGDSSIDKTLQYVLEAKTQSISYKGQNFGRMAFPTSDKTLRTFIGRKNKNSQEISLYETSSVVLLPQIDKGAKDDSLDSLDSSFAMKQNNLAKQFGSAKKVRGVEQSEQLKMSSMQRTQADLFDATQEMDISFQDVAKIKDEAEDALIPPINRRATSSDDVFSYKDLLSEEEMRMLLPLAANILESKEEEIKSWESKKLYSDFFFKGLQRIKGRVAEKLLTQQYRVQLLLYAECFIKFLKLKYNELSKRDALKVDSVPNAILNKVVDMFTEKNGTKRTRSQSMKDKTVCYLIVTSLLSLYYSIDIPLLASATGYKNDHLQNLCRTAGATIVNATSTGKSIAELRVPIPEFSLENEKKRDGPGGKRARR